MKKGDIVTINDGSYTKSVVNGKLVHEHLCFGSNFGKQYKVIEIDCKFPSDERHQRNHGRFNNTVIQDIDSGKIVFIEEMFLRLRYRVPPVREVTLAEICERFGGPVVIRL